MQPFSDTGHQCTLLLMSNIAQTQWVSVGCNVKLLDTTVCQTKDNKSKLVNPMTEMRLRNITCTKLDLLLDGSCYLFLNYNEDMNAFIMKRLCQDSNKKLYVVNNMKHLDIFWHFFMLHL